MPKVVIERGSGRGDTFRIESGGRLIVGRDKDADVRLTDTLVSRKHVVIEGRADGYVVRDNESLNGVLLNGKRVMEAKLQPGDRIQVGDTLMSFLLDDERRNSGGLIGLEVAGHKIVERIGRGGMGTVYKAIQLSLDRPLAMKFLAQEFVEDPVFITRFVCEARAAGKLNHMNIVQVFDTGRWEGRCYYTMEYMPFGSVGEKISGGQKIPVKNALPMMVDVAHGLIYAEKKGLVHRDIKPDNLMIGYDGVIKIGDLGIAKMMYDEKRIGQQDGVFGSAHYMAPEQARGQSIDCRVDIYAMGTTFYRILTGKTPFSGDSMQEIIENHMVQKAAPVHEMEPSVPLALSKIIEKMMAKDVKNRYKSANDFLAELTMLAEEHQ